MSLISDGVLAIGYGEKCPYCKFIIVENMNVLEHMKTNHKKELEIALFGGEINV